MPVPGFQEFMLPMMKICSDGKEHNIHEIIEDMKKNLLVSDSDANILIPSGTQTVLNNRVTWARTYLIKAGLLEFTRRTYCIITERGKEALRESPSRIDIRYLKRYPEFLEFHDAKRMKPGIPNDKEIVRDLITPDEKMEDAYEEMRDSLAEQIVSNAKRCSPAFFERLVVELLVKMGYGGSWRDAARAVGQSGDGGVDGIIDEDRLGLDAVYIQAKRWDGPVGRPEIQKFVGALMGRRARKGIFITTSTFSTEAQNYVNSIDYRIVLIDGKRLAEYMIDYDIGVSEVITYRIKRIDSDYFSND